MSRLCSFGRMLLLYPFVTIISMGDTHTECTFVQPILSHGAVCSSSHRPFWKKPVLHPTLLNGEGITVREQIHFQSACWGWDYELKPMIATSRGAHPLIPTILMIFDAHHGTVSQNIAKYSNLAGRFRSSVALLADLLGLCPGLPG